VYLVGRPGCSGLRPTVIRGAVKRRVRGIALFEDDFVAEFRYAKSTMANRWTDRRDITGLGVKDEESAGVFSNPGWRERAADLQKRIAGGADSDSEILMMRAGRLGVDINGSELFTDREGRQRHSFELQMLLWCSSSAREVDEEVELSKGRWKDVM
jgi:hypothetical protein